MISNTVTVFRLCLTIPLFLLLALHGPGWIALSLFLVAGALDILDGKLARSLGEASAFGAMLDLIGDRMLTLAAVAGLLTAGVMPIWSAAFAMILVLRDLFAAAFAEALKGRSAIPPSPLEPLKIAFAFAGLGLAMLPAAAYPNIGLAQDVLTAALLGLAAILAIVTLAGYWRATLRTLAQD
ncbi:CDP-alcohol phosphatidyltransferase family protein [Hyphococcus sp.]|uniref:CDP-alcohol phosphatidyltransferase family protein n=1 Tax=Hyphococcus sp. TaxID=2038636 RepID=UPI0035C681A5